MTNPDDGMTRVTRDCTVTTIPSGRIVTLPAGEPVEIVQALGGSTTVRLSHGLLVRVAAVNADALGLAPAEPTAPSSTDRFQLSQVIDALGTIYDPEIPVSIVELGLIYRCEEVWREDGTRRISIDMSMTAPGCGMGDVLRGDAIRAVKAVPGVDEVEVTLVWDPPWEIGRMSEAARLQLGML